MRDAAWSIDNRSRRWPQRPTGGPSRTAGGAHQYDEYWKAAPFKDAGASDITVLHTVDLGADTDDCCFRSERARRVSGGGRPVRLGRYFEHHGLTQEADLLAGARRVVS